MLGFRVWGLRFRVCWSGVYGLVLGFHTQVDGVELLAHPFDLVAEGKVDWGVPQFGAYSKVLTVGL